MPLTVEQMSFNLGVSQASAALGRARDCISLAQAWSLEVNAMSPVNDAIQNGIADRVIAEHAEMPQRLTVESLGSG